MLIAKSLYKITSLESEKFDKNVEKNDIEDRNAISITFFLSFDNLVTIYPTFMDFSNIESIKTLRMYWHSGTE